MRILPANLDAMLVELDSLEETLALFDALQTEPIAGITELVPAARTVLVTFDPSICRPERLADAIAGRQVGGRQQASGALLILPVRYDGEDLAEMAEHLGLSVAALIERHTKAIWQVAFTGFAPGFAYMTGDDPLFDVPRRASPRTKIPAGSVALAGRFCGIYPRSSPGGWQLLGTTMVPMWDLARQPPALLQPGGRVRFVDVATEEGQRLVEHWRRAADALSAEGTRIGGDTGTCLASSVSAVSADTSAVPSSDLAVSMNRADVRGMHAVEHMLPLAAANDASDAQGAGLAHPADEAGEVRTEPPPSASMTPHLTRPVPDAFEVLATGLQAIFQDQGREGQASQGVSASGALDKGACMLANRLVGNDRRAPVLEILHGGFSVRVLSPVVVAITGAEGALELRHADGSAWPAERNRPLALDPGDTLTIGAPDVGLRSYLAVRGGFKVAPVLGSAATDTLSGIGPEPVSVGQILSVGQWAKGAVMMHHDIHPANPPYQPVGDDAGSVVLDIVLGPRTDWFTPDTIELLQRQSWQVTLQSNRVGLRLVGEQPLVRAPAFEGVELPSEGTALGALQVPANGQPVLFLADHPLTGGYPVIGCVVPHHLDSAAQLPAGVHVRFRVVSPFRAYFNGESS
ncbi:MAG: urea amidolyase family protein [Lautropia sp.]|nr:urea amidolyase family protein [Lautropia sp.]